MPKTRTDENKGRVYGLLWALRGVEGFYELLKNPFKK